MITLVIPAAPPSPNKLYGKHWRVRWKNSLDWQKWIRVAICNQLPARPDMLARAKVTIERSGHLLDPDNLVGSVKCVVDALKHNRLIVDDSPAHLELTVTQVRGPAQTQIQLEAA